MRLFFALWPSASAAQALAAWAEEVRALSGGRRTAEGNIHLTLAFLGQADPARAIAAARRVQGAPHRLPIEHARCVNRMVWAGPRETPAPLAALHQALAIELFREEFILERRPFAAHVTLLRDARGAVLQALPAIDWPVGEFVLVKSSLSRRGPSYEAIERFQLAH
jgi:RNA 2',3'-cyclic 3'-phosphodiesterase